MTPGLTALVVLSLATFRVWHLLAYDTVLDGLRAWVFRWDGEGEPPAAYRRRLDDFIGCPWCAGFWVALAWWAAWLVWPATTLRCALLPAVSAVAALLSKL